MQSTLFAGRARNALAVLVSLLALLAVAAYVASPSDAIAAKMTASYQRAARSLVEGVVMSPNGRADGRGEVVVVFENGRGGLVREVRVRVNAHGQFYVAVPRGAKEVDVIAFLRPGKKAPHGASTFRLLPGRSLSLVIVFHRSGGGLLPAVFPY